VASQAGLGAKTRRTSHTISMLTYDNIKLAVGIYASLLHACLRGFWASGSPTPNLGLETIEPSYHQGRPKTRSPADVTTNGQVPYMRQTEEAWTAHLRWRPHAPASVLTQRGPAQPDQPGPASRTTIPPSTAAAKCSTPPFLPAIFIRHPRPINSRVVSGGEGSAGPRHGKRRGGGRDIGSAQWLFGFFWWRTRTARSSCRTVLRTWYPACGTWRQE
jgi:hypothetical protein